MTGRHGPRGLLQGSPASNLILAWLLNDMPSVLPPDCALFLLTDNVLVAARTEEMCREMEQTLVRYFAEHRAGPFVLHGEITSIGRGFERAGYEFELSLLRGVQVGPSGANTVKFYSSLYAALERDFQAGHVEPTESRRVLSAKLSGFRATTDFESWREAELEHLRMQFWSNAEREVTRILRSLPPELQLAAFHNAQDFWGDSEDEDF
jgi:hypothetical protein